MIGQASVKLVLSSKSLVDMSTLHITLFPGPCPIWIAGAIKVEAVVLSRLHLCLAEMRILMWSSRWWRSSSNPLVTVSSKLILLVIIFSKPFILPGQGG